MLEQKPESAGSSELKTPIDSALASLESSVDPSSTIDPQDKYTISKVIELLQQNGTINPQAVDQLRTGTVRVLESLSGAIESREAITAVSEIDSSESDEVTLHSNVVEARSSLLRRLAESASAGAGQPVGELLIEEISRLPAVQVSKIGQDISKEILDSLLEIKKRASDRLKGGADNIERLDTQAKGWREELSTIESRYKLAEEDPEYGDEVIPPISRLRATNEFYSNLSQQLSQAILETSMDYTTRSYLHNLIAQLATAATFDDALSRVAVRERMLNALIYQDAAYRTISEYLSREEVPELLPVVAGNSLPQGLLTVEDIYKSSAEIQRHQALLDQIANVPATISWFVQSDTLLARYLDGVTEKGLESALSSMKHDIVRLEAVGFGLPDDKAIQPYEEAVLRYRKHQDAVKNRADAVPEQPDGEIATLAEELLSMVRKDLGEEVRDIARQLEKQIKENSELQIQLDQLRQQAEALEVQVADLSHQLAASQTDVTDSTNDSVYPVTLDNDKGGEVITEDQLATLTAALRPQQEVRYRLNDKAGQLVKYIAPTRAPGESPTLYRGKLIKAYADYLKEVLTNSGNNNTFLSGLRPFDSIPDLQTIVDLLLELGETTALPRNGGITDRVVPVRTVLSAIENRDVNGLTNSLNIYNVVMKLLRN